VSGLGALVGQAAEITVVLSSTDGTASFDDLDANNNNGIVRTNDLIEYTVNPTFRDDQTHAFFVLTLPKGVYLQNFPEICGAGSTVDPAVTAIPAPTVPVTSTSWQALPVQTLTCQLGTISGVNASGTGILNYPIVAKVRGEVPNGQALTASVTVQSDQVPATAPVMVTDQVAAAPRYDISLNGFAAVANQGPKMIPGLMPCRNVAHEGKTCQMVVLPLTISVTNAKGISPASEFGFTYDLSPETLWGVTMTDQEIAEYGAALVWFGTMYQDVVGPGKLIDAALGQTATNSARNSGTAWCSSEAPGAVVDCTMSAGDYTAYSTPTQNLDGSAIPSDQAVVVSMTMAVEYPAKTMQLFGTGSESWWVLNSNWGVTNFQATDINGQTNLATADVADNNTRQTTTNASLWGSAEMSILSPAGVTGNTPMGEYLPSWHLYEGPTYSHDNAGDGLVYPGQQVISTVQNTNANVADSGGDPTQNQTFVNCNYWDNSQLWLDSTVTYEPQGESTVYGAAPAGRPVWTMATYALAPSWGYVDLEPQIWYSNQSTMQAGQSCGDDLTWYSSPADVPGNDETLAAEGVYTAVNMVRIEAVLPAAGLGASNAWYGIGQRVADTLEAGEVIGSWLSYINEVGNTYTAQNLIDWWGFQT
jgi:hypothetical protein